jgi:hypothetical protein
MTPFGAFGKTPAGTEQTIGMLSLWKLSSKVQLLNVIPTKR